MKTGRPLFSLTLHALLAALLSCLCLGGAVAQDRKANQKTDDYQPVLELLRLGQFSQANAKAEAYLASRPRDPQMRFIQGMIQQSSGQTDAAQATYLALTQDYPELPEPHNHLAVLLAAQGKVQEARAELDLALRANPGYATAHENLGDVYLQLARQAYESARALGGTPSITRKLDGLRQLLPSASAPVTPATLPTTRPATPLAPSPR